VRNITIKEIAGRASVSTTTVSSVLNGGKIIVGAGTRQRILDAVKELGYRPSRGAKQLRSRKSRVIALQIDSRIMSDEAWRPTVLLSLLQVQGICAYARGRGYDVSLMIPRHGKDVEEIEAQVVKENSVDGIILTGWKDLPEVELEALLASLVRCDIPVVTLDYKIYERGYPSVSVNLRAGIKKACSRLVGLGHVRIGYVGRMGVVNPLDAQQRFDIISEELASYGLAFPAGYVVDISSEVDCYRKTLKILESAEDRPSCVIYHGDHMAMAGISAIMDLGLEIPGDISVLGIDNAPYAEGAPVPLATVDQKHYEQGVMLAKQMIDKIENPDSPVPGLSVIETEFVDRASLGRAKEA